MKDFTQTNQTKSGIKVRDIKFSELMGVWTGQIFDPKWGSEGRWLSTSWSKTGKCRMNPHLDL